MPGDGDPQALRVGRRDILRNHRPTAAPARRGLSQTRKARSDRLAGRRASRASNRPPG